MADSKLNISTAVHDAFTAFLKDRSLFALPIILDQKSLLPLPHVPQKARTISFQTTLNELNTILQPRVPLYLILRREVKLVAITFVPYLAPESQRTFYMQHRQSILRSLGERHFSQSLVCKEIGEIIDARSWTERDEAASHLETSAKHASEDAACNEDSCDDCTTQERGYKRNKCRLCDRRMMNRMGPDALDAFASLKEQGSVVQFSVDILTETLILNFSKPDTPAQSIPCLLPTSSPSFTFYRHPDTTMLYFIYHSPDTAAVQQRMKHTLAIPGLLVHAEDAGVLVDRKIEIHDSNDLVFQDEEDKRVGRFRSMYRREGFNGTELMYEGMDRDKELLDAL